MRKSLQALESESRTPTKVKSTKEESLTNLLTLPFGLEMLNNALNGSVDNLCLLLTSLKNFQYDFFDKL